jgi:hypothetical protein
MPILHSTLALADGTVLRHDPPSLNTHPHKLKHSTRSCSCRRHCRSMPAAGRGVDWCAAGYREPDAGSIQHVGHHGFAIVDLCQCHQHVSVQFGYVQEQGSVLLGWAHLRDPGLFLLATSVPHFPPSHQHVPALFPSSIFCQSTRTSTRTSHLFLDARVTLELTAAMSLSR